MIVQKNSPIQGSPPPMRGKGHRRKTRSLKTRITPAYAGKRCASDGIWRIWQDHPRLCGEKPTKQSQKKTNAVTGSPPPMRGKGYFFLLCQSQCRITPAYAGKSHLESLNRYIHDGSPPPMRGKVTPPSKISPLFRITPAYAGKSSGFSNHKEPRRDHPRLCGEKQKSLADTTLRDGSPPPMRGKAVRHAVSVADHGITPAYAGKSCIQLSSYGLKGDHPRLCGEKTY